MYSLARRENGGKHLSSHLRRLAMERSRGPSKSIDPDRIHHDETPERRLDFLLRNLADTKCFIATDRIFALLSIEVKAPEDPDIVPYYTVDDLTLCIRIWESRRVSYEARYGIGSTQLLSLMVGALGLSREGVDNELATRVRNHASSEQKDSFDHHPVQGTTETHSYPTPPSLVRASASQRRSNAVFRIFIICVIIGIFVGFDLIVKGLSVEPSAHKGRPTSPTTAPQPSKESTSESSKQGKERMSLFSWLTWTFLAAVLTGGLSETYSPGVLLGDSIWLPRISDPAIRKSRQADLLRPFTWIAAFSCTVTSLISHGRGNYVLSTAVNTWVEVERAPKSVLESLERDGLVGGQLIIIGRCVSSAYICSLSYIFHLAAGPLKSYLEGSGNGSTDEQVAWRSFIEAIALFAVGRSWWLFCRGAYSLIPIIQVVMVKTDSSGTRTQSAAAGSQEAETYRLPGQMVRRRIPNRVDHGRRHTPYQ